MLLRVFASFLETNLFYLAGFTGVPLDRVKIISVESYLTPIASGLRSRIGQHGKVVVVLKVFGALRLQGLSTRLQKRGVPVDGLRMQVSKGHHVSVRRKPDSMSQPALG